jgi:ketosteroid isomerase-like protein
LTFGRATARLRIITTMHERLIRDLYASFNARDVDAVIAHLHPDVDWPNAWEGGRLNGHAGVREYWARQFAQIDGRVEPIEIAETDDGRIAVTVHQTVRSLTGEMLSDVQIGHVYTIRDGRIVHMEVVETG